MIEANRIKLGIFLTFGILVIIGGIFIFGVFQFFEPSYEVYTIFAGSVDGLTIGSPVRFNGVRLGNVTNILICENGDIAVYMEIFQKTLNRKASSKLTRRLYETNDNPNDKDWLIKEGLRCSMQLVSISGDKGIDLAFMDQNKFKSYLPDLVGESNAYYIPSVQNYMPFAIDNLCRTLENISSIDFKEIANNVNRDLYSLKVLAERLEVMMNKIQIDEINNSLISSLNQFDEMSNGITTLTRNLGSNPSSLIWGTTEKPVFTDPPSQSP